MISITNLTSLALALLTVQMIFSYSFPLFAPFSLFIFVFYLIRGDFNIDIVKELYFFLFVTMLFFLWGGILSDKFYDHFSKELINGLSTMMLFPVLANIFRNGQFTKFKESFIKISAMLIFPISIFSLYKFYKLLLGIQLDWLTGKNYDTYPWGTALQPDYNFGALGFFVGASSAFWLFANTKGVIAKSILFISANVMLITSLLTGSRRMYITFGLIIIVLFGFAITKLYKFLKNLLHEPNIRLALKGMIQIVVSIAGIASIMGIFLAIGIFPVNGIDQHEIYKLTYRLESLSVIGETLKQSRGVYLSYAFELINNFTYAQIFFGDGFDYLKYFGFRFSNSINAEDYPHNPVLSGFLYGGVFNAILILFFILRSIALYVIYRKYDSYFFILFTVVFLFSFVSANSLYSIRLFLVLLAIPFFFHQHKYKAVNK